MTRRKETVVFSRIIDSDTIRVVLRFDRQPNENPLWVHLHRWREGVAFATFPKPDSIGLLDGCWQVAWLDFQALFNHLKRAGGTNGEKFHLEFSRISSQGAALLENLLGGCSTPTLEDLFWGPDMPLRSKADRAAYFVYLDELRREARGGGITTPKKNGEDRPQLHGGLDAMLVRQGGEIISGKMYIQGNITLIESAAYGVAARVINTKDIPSDGVVDLEKVDSLRVVHAGKNLDFIASFKG
jgi:hypothetical protein